MEEDLLKFNSNSKPTRITRRLIKSYEKNIPLRKVEITKLKSELDLDSLKAKEMQTHTTRKTTWFNSWKWKFTLEKRNFRNGTKIIRNK